MPMKPVSTKSKRTTKQESKQATGNRVNGRKVFGGLDLASVTDLCALELQTVATDDLTEAKEIGR